MIHTPRKDNSAADAAANEALDHGDFLEVYTEVIAEFCNRAMDQPLSEIGLVFSFDGASRGNPGKSSQGNCAWWGTWQHGHFHEEALLFRSGRNLGHQTNNIAEVRGLAFALKAALHLHFWMLEGCARMAARRMY